MKEVAEESDWVTRKLLTNNCVQLSMLFIRKVTAKKAGEKKLTYLSTRLRGGEMLKNDL